MSVFPYIVILPRFQEESSLLSTSLKINSLTANKKHYNTYNNSLSDRKTYWN